MANTETLTSLIQNIANSIREKTQKTDLLTLQQMPSEILSIPEGGGLTFDQVISRNYEDLNITDLIVQTESSINIDSSNEEINNYLLRNSTFNNLHIENLSVINRDFSIHSSFLYKSIFNSLTINNFTIDTPNPDQELFFDNPNADPLQIPSIRINKINCNNSPFYFNFSQKINCLFLNLQEVTREIILNRTNGINKIILVNDMSSTRPLSYQGHYYQGDVYCSAETSPEFQQNIQDIFPQVQFMSNEECENLWDTEIMVQH